MNKAILFVTFISIIFLISAISPPKFPSTFFSNVKLVNRVANVTHVPVTGSVANDDVKKLYVYNEKSSPIVLENALFNTHLYEYYGQPVKCGCFNITYKDARLPFFGRYRNFVEYKVTNSDIIWKCTDAPPGDTLLFTVRKVTPNIPESIISYAIFENITYSQNITFSGFQTSQPDGDLFKIPNDCTKVICRNKLKKPSMFSKFF